MKAQIEAWGGEDVVFERIASGETIESITNDLGVSRSMLYWWRGRPDSAKGRKWQEARKRSAEARAEQGLRIVDEVAVDADGKMRDPTIAQVKAAQNRADYRWKLAATADPETYGDKREAAVVVNVNALHLDALRSVGMAGRELGVVDVPQLESGEPTEE